MLAAGLAPARDQPDPGAEQQEPTYESPSVLSGPNAFGNYARVTGAYAIAPGGTSDGENPPVPERASQTDDDRAPSVLSQETSPWQESKGPMNAFGLYAQIIGVYDSGLLAPTILDGKRVAPVASSGEESNFGAKAVRRWPRGELGIDYRGSYWHYSNAPEFDGLDQFLQLAYREALTRHLMFDFNTTAGSTTLANGGFSYFPVTALDRLGIPTEELFDNRTRFLQARSGLAWQISSRLSIDFGGDGFIVRRNSLLLAGLNGYNARASAAYRLTQRQTISAVYENTDFDFNNTFGESRLETAAVGYSARLTREWDLSTLVGGVRVGTVGLTEIAIDPAAAAILGQYFALVTFHNISYLPIAELQLVRRFREASLTFDFSDSISPGNGLYLTSRQTSGTVIYSYIASRDLRLRANAGYGQLSALGQTLGIYSNLQAGIQVLYKLAGDAFLDVRYDYRHYNTGDAILRMDSNRVSVGIAFSLGQASPLTW